MDWLDEIEERARATLKLYEHFEQRQSRAAERLAKETVQYWNFAVLGLPKNTPEFVFHERMGALRAVVEPPGAVELASALKNKGLMNAVGRYSGGITHELSIVRDDDPRHPFTYAHWIISALRVRTGADLLIPVAANYSWSTVSAVTDSCEVTFVEDYPRARSFGSVEVAEEDFRWVAGNLLNFATVWENAQFRHAIEAFTTLNQQHNLRVAVAQAWSAIEALLGVQQELRFRVSAILATALSPRGDERKKLYGRLKKLYDVRSKAVHGSAVEDADLKAHLVEVRGILRRFLCATIEANHVATVDELESALFS